MDGKDNNTNPCSDAGFLPDLREEMRCFGIFLSEIVVFMFVDR